MLEIQYNSRRDNGRNLV